MKNFEHIKYTYKHRKIVMLLAEKYFKDNQELLDSQYDVIHGSWPKNYNEVVLVVNDENEVSDYALYSLGLLDQAELKNSVQKIMAGEKLEEKERLEYDGITLSQNNMYGQEVKHYHLHLIPKYKEEEKLSIEEVYNKLK